MLILYILIVCVNILKRLSWSLTYEADDDHLHSQCMQFIIPGIKQFQRLSLIFVLHGGPRR